jgi:hypothetical protein
MFSESAVIKRKPLAATARRAGWVGCNARKGSVLDIDNSPSSESHLKD